MADELTGKDVATLEWFTVRELSLRWRISDGAVIRIIKSGALRAKKFGGQWRIHVTAVDAYEQGAKPRQQASARPAVVIDRGDPLGLYSSSPSRGRTR